MHRTRRSVPQRPRLSLRSAIWILLPVLACGCQATRPQRSWEATTAATSDYRILQDHRNLYSPEGLALLGAGFGAGGALAHSQVDEEFQTWYQEHLQSSATADFSRSVKPLGEGYVAIPVLAAGLLAGELYDDTQPGSAVADWADRSLRSVLVGAPPLLIAQSVTGSSRPDEHNGTAWRPLEDNNGVSGHAFIGAFPLITAAQMTENPYGKAALYAASAVPAWSRVEDDAHFASQAFLGWWVAYAACSAVHQTEAEQEHLQLTPVEVPGGMGIGILWEH